MNDATGDYEVIFLWHARLDKEPLMPSERVWTPRFAVRSSVRYRVSSGRALWEDFTAEADADCGPRRKTAERRLIQALGTVNRARQDLSGPVTPWIERLIDLNFFPQPTRQPSGDEIDALRRRIGDVLAVVRNSILLTPTIVCKPEGAVGCEEGKDRATGAWSKPAPGRALAHLPGLFRNQVLTLIHEFVHMAGFGHDVRTWGEVVSIELLRGKKKVFSFQVAERTALIEDPTPAPWTDVLLDSFADLVANKMTALVERGAPRDFRDVYTVCENGLVNPAGCWQLWRERQQRAGVSTDVERARLAVETQLARIVQHRPLDRIADPAERSMAERRDVGTKRSFSMPSWIDGTLYPDTDVPDSVETLDERVDFLARLSAAWDFGVLPEHETVVEIRRPEWRAAVDACRLLTSPTYHLVRKWHGLPEVPYLGQELAYIRDDPNLAYI